MTSDTFGEVFVDTDAGAARDDIIIVSSSVSRRHIVEQRSRLEIVLLAVTQICSKKKKLHVTFTNFLDNKS